MKFLIAGLGSIGRRHLRNLITLGEKDIVLYRTHLSTLPDSDLAGFRIETDLQAALAHKPDGVIVSNPTAFHLDIAIPAAEAKCHIFLEKPVSHSLDHTDILANFVQQYGVKILVGYQFRFHPGLRYVIHLLNHRAIGRPLTARAHWGEYLPDWHPWEDYRLGYSARADMGGGVVLTLSHPLDYLLWMFGDADNLWAFTGTYGNLELEVEDNAEILIKFKQGTVASIHLDYNQRPPAHHLEIIGTHGTIRWDNVDGSVQLYQTINSSNDSGKWQTFPAKSLTNEEKSFERNDLFLSEMKHFISVLRGEEEPICTLEDGINVLKLCLASYQSSQHGHKINFTT
jgi:predicted dehydrogenase